MTRPTRLAVMTVMVLALGGAALFPGCSGCQGSKAPLAYVPKDAVVAVVVPSVSGSVRALTKLMDALQSEAALKNAVDAKKQQLVQELGFDPQKPETMKAKGLDPSRGLAFSLGADGTSTALVLGVSDSKALEKYLRETAQKLLGGGATFKEQKVDGLDATLLLTQGDQEPRLAWVYHEKQLIICPRSKDGKAAEYAAKLAKQKSSIKDNSTFSRLRDKVDKHDLLVYVDGAATKKMVAARTAERLKTASDWLKKSLERQKENQEAVLAYFDGAAMGLQLTGKGLVMRSYLAIPGGKAKMLREILTGTGDAPAFGELIGPDALAVARATVNPKKLVNKLLELVPPREKRRFYRKLDRLERETKINFEKDILSQLSGRFAMALFAPNADALKQGFSLRQPQRLLGAISLLGMVQVNDSRKAADLLNTLERMMVSAGTDVRARQEGKARIFFVGAADSPTVSWTVHKGLGLVATGDRLSRTLKLMEKGGDNVLGEITSSRAKKQFNADNGNVLYYNVAKTADTIRGLAMPAQIKLMLSSVLTTLAKFSDVTWTVEPEDQGMLSEVSVRLK